MANSSTEPDSQTVRRRGGCHPLIKWLLLGAVSVACAQAHAVDGVHALLINGGHRPASNYLSHLHHLKEMHAVLRGRGVDPARIHVFSADGEAGGADLASRDTKPADFWLIEGTALGKRLQPRSRLTNTEWPGVALYPARRAALQDWFNTIGGELAPGEQLFIFVTDHGTGNKDDPDNGAISLWEEKLTVREFKELLGQLPAGVRVVMVMSQCYSGTFADAMYLSGLAEPFGDVCGFFSTQRDLKAYGCYPEGRDRDRLGHAFRFIDALTRRGTTAEAHVEVLSTDRTPDVPLRTSDVYTERLVAETAAARGEAMEVVGDALLKQAWRHQAAWEPEVRLLDRIGETFGTFSPRSLAEIGPYETQLAGLSKQMKTYARRWALTLVDLKEAAVLQFLDGRPEWKSRLDAKAPDAQSEQARAALLAELLPELARYVHSQPGLRERLQRLGDNARRSSETVWRLDVRWAALRRMRSILLHIAAHTLLEQPGQSGQGSNQRSVQAEALGRLQQCEALAAGEPPAPVESAEAPPANPFPPLAEEFALIDEVLPSWLGVRFRKVDKSVARKRGLPVGATMIQTVYPESPAKAAGLAPGDIVLGPPGRPFDSQKQLREWTMVSPRGVPLPLAVLRPGTGGKADARLELALTLYPYPLELPKLPGPPQIGQRAPVIAAALKPLGTRTLPVLAERPHLLFFWATWCRPCKAALPEVMAFAEARGLPVLTISDEDPDTVTEYLRERKAPFFELIAIDPLRETFIAHGVSGTPTIVWVDAEGMISHRQVGYNTRQGLRVDGWSWTKP